MKAKCHLCPRYAEDVKYCRDCQHWFCPTCRKSYFARALAKLHEIMHGKVDGCCGPKDNSMGRSK